MITELGGNEEGEQRQEPYSFESPSFVLRPGLEICVFDDLRSGGCWEEISTVNLKAASSLKCVHVSMTRQRVEIDERCNWIHSTLSLYPLIRSSA